jgi:hypothetical protein
MQKNVCILFLFLLFVITIVSSCEMSSKIRKLEDLNNLFYLLTSANVEMVTQSFLWFADLYFVTFWFAGSSFYTTAQVQKYLHTFSPYK